MMNWSPYGVSNLSHGKRVLQLVFLFSDISVGIVTLFMAWSTWTFNSAVTNNFAQVINAPDLYIYLYACLQLLAGVCNLLLLALRHERTTRAAMLFALFVPLHIGMTFVFNLGSGSWIALALYTFGYIQFCLLALLREPYDRVLK